MYVTGVVAVLVVIFSVLMMLHVVPFDAVVVGALFIGVALACAGPFIGVWRSA